MQCPELPKGAGLKDDFKHQGCLLVHGAKVRAHLAEPEKELSDRSHTFFASDGQQDDLEWLRDKMTTACYPNLVLQSTQPIQAGEVHDRHSLPRQLSEFKHASLTVSKDQQKLEARTSEDTSRSWWGAAMFVSEG